MAHGRGGRSAVPVPLPRRDPNQITRPDFLDRPVFALNPAAASGDDQSLTEWVRMLRRARAGLEGDQSTRNTGRIRRAEQRINTHGSSEILYGSFVGRL
jgi:hypothetical protein